MTGDDRGRTAFADDLDIAEARVGQQLCHRLGAALHLGAAGRVGPHRFDAHQVFQVGPHRRQDLAHTGDHIGHDGGVVLRSPTKRANAHRLARRGGPQTRSPRRRKR